MKDILIIVCVYPLEVRDVFYSSVNVIFILWMLFSFCECYFRSITFSPYLCHTDPIFKDLNLLPISKLVTQRIGLLMFKYSIHSLPSVIEDLFTCNTSVSNHNTRNKSKLRQPEAIVNICIETLVSLVFIFGIKFKTTSTFTLHTAHLKMHLNLSSWFTIWTIESYKCSFVNKITYTVFLYVIIYLIFVVS